MNWTDRRHDVGDSSGSASAGLEAQLWDGAYARVATALRASVSPGV